MSKDQELKNQKDDFDDLKNQIKEKDEKIQENEQLINECQNQLLRMQADLENYKKHTEKRMQDHLERANENLIIKILEAYEDLQRALQAEKSDDLREGVELIYQKLRGVLENEGLEEITAEGEKFDPFKHEALMAEDNEKYENGCIIQELGKGYTLNSKVIKYSKVKVCKKGD
ncbi:MAG TPA: nucleotide exchange factor GrpE [Methanobacteriaceae archaeon]|nr:nucleotide exchange factor GrpE [Methanobacteriaceae archaeon]